ncbi:non-ribosomal peptide synthetase [Paenibacillus uliginis]|uniref:non-ribosomal peptide synthetase n=1 Tax=Paenibacillus uliginis TaxID=683737 RepID=UPI001AD816DF|nr:non-ribosomal peptide synthetase [Paenibacillus uliginis]
MNSETVIGLHLSDTANLIAFAIGALKSGAQLAVLDNKKADAIPLHLLITTSDEMSARNYSSHTTIALDLLDEEISKQPTGDICNIQNMESIALRVPVSGQEAAIYSHTDFLKYVLQIEEHFIGAKHSRVIIHTHSLSPLIVLVLVFMGLRSTRIEYIDITDSLDYSGDNETALFIHKNEWSTLSQKEQNDHLSYIVLDEKPMLCKQIVTWLEQVGSKKITFGYISKHLSQIMTYLHIANQEITLNSDMDLMPIGKLILPDSGYVLDKRRRKSPVGVRGELFFQVKSGEQLNNNYNMSLYRAGLSATLMPNQNIMLNDYTDNIVEVDGVKINGDLIQDLLQLNDDILFVKTEYDEVDGQIKVYVSVREQEQHIFETIHKQIQMIIPRSAHRAKIYIIQNSSAVLSEEIDIKTLETAEVTLAAKNSENQNEEKIIQIIKEIQGSNHIAADINLFEQGLNSLQSLRLIASINAEFSIQLELYDVYNHPTVREIAGLIQDCPVVNEGIEKAPNKEYYELSLVQKQIWEISNLKEGSTSYNEISVHTVEGQLNIDALNRAFQSLIERHESLRTTFVTVDKEPRQKIHSSDEYGFALEKINVNSSGDVEEIINEEKMFVFDLPNGPLLRARLLCKSEKQQYVLIINRHHLISDGWSDAVLFNDLITLYNAYATGSHNPLIPLSLQYKDYSEWQNNMLQSNKFDEHKHYWQERFGGELNRLELPRYKNRPKAYSFTGKTVKYTFNHDRARKIGSLVKKNSTNLFTAVVGILSVMFHKYTGLNDIILGTTMADRSHIGLEKQIGFYVNTLPIRTIIEENDSFLQLIDHVKTDLQSMIKYRDYPFDKIVRDLDIKTELGHMPLFDILVEVLNFETLQNEGISLEGDIQLQKYEWENETSVYDLNLMFGEINETIQLEIRYNTDIYEEQQIEHIWMHLNQLVDRITDDPTSLIQNYNMVPDSELKLLEQFNLTSYPIPEDTLVTIIEREAVHNPTKAVIQFGDEVVRYGELQQRSNEIAHFLMNTSQGSKTAVLMDRSPEIVESILAIWKSGGIYIPVEPKNPYERIKNIIDDAQIPYLIFSKKYLKIASQLQWECPSLTYILCIDSDNIAKEEEEKRHSMNSDLWNQVVQRASDQIEEGAWFNSYTGKPFSRLEMDEYAENAKNKLLPYLHKQAKVLEIGCSSGITMFSIAPYVKKYVGIDLSKEIIERNKKIVENEGISNIELHCKYAHEIDELEDEDFDVIILNSVIQNFNGLNYLRKVINNIINKSKSEALIFLGDLMDIDKKEEFISSLVEFESQNRGMGYKTWKDWSEHLFISKNFLNEFVYDITEIESVTHSDKIFTIENELTKYRFDTTIKVKKTCAKENTIYDKTKYQFDRNDLSNYKSEKQSINLSKFDQEAYIIYTSGSTGKPKGAIVEHAGMVNHIHAKIKDLKVDSTAVIAQNASQGFDISIWQLFTSLAVGGTTVIYSDDCVKDPDLFLTHIFKDEINVLEVVPSYLSVLLDGIKQMRLVNRAGSLEYLLVTGEEVKAELVNRAFEILEDIIIVNAYGPTEASDDITHYIINEPLDKSTVPIGRPIINTNIYIVDKYMNLCPVGVWGEICVAGICVGKGYVNDKQKTDKVFMRNPFVDSKHERMYLTGDLGRWLPDGTIEFLGRKDKQVKVRGFRIELQEIENTILTYPQVKQSVVLALDKPDGSKELCAYIVANHELVEDTLKEYLYSKLPEYSVPAHFISLEKLPLTINGKVDQRRLPKPEGHALQQHAYVEPTNKIEKELQTIWSEILSNPLIGIDDDLFKIGGHSIVAIKISNKIREVLMVGVPLNIIFDKPTIRQLASYIEQLPNKSYNEDNAWIEINKAGKKDSYKLAPVQLPEWYLHQLDSESTNYNIPIELMFRGNLNLKAFEKAWNSLIEKNSVFRTTFDITNGEPIQIIHEEIKFELSEVYFDYSDLPKYEALKKAEELALSHAHQVFDFTNGPMFSVQLVQIDRDHHLFLFATHHILWDEVSSINLISELSRLYNSFNQDINNQVISQSSEIDYIDYVEWVNSSLEKGLFHRQRDYWLEKFKTVPEPLQLPTDYVRPEIQTFEGATIFEVIHSELRDEIHRFCEKNNITEFMFIYAVLSLQMHILSGQNDFVLSSPIRNRNHEKLDKLLGSFASAIMLRSQYNKNIYFTDFIRQAKETAVGAYENHLYPSNLLLEDLKLNRDLSRSGFFSIMFGLQNDKNDFLKEDHFDGLKMEVPSEIKVHDKASRFDLNLAYDDINGVITIYCNFNTALFKESTVQKIVQQNINLMKQVLQQPDKLLSEYSLVSTEELNRIVFEFNDTAASYDISGGLHRKFEEKAESDPYEIAIIYENTTMSYEELNARANKLANYLIRNGVRKEDKIGVLAAPCPDLVVALLGILKAGCAYVPLNPDFPPARKQYIIQDCSIQKIVLAGQFKIDSLNFEGEYVLLDSAEIAECSPFNPNKTIDLTQLAYVIYTSGTTGVPKGIEIEHKGVSNLLEWTQKTYRLNKNESTLLNTSFTFDVSILEIFWPLTVGAKIVVLNEENRNKPEVIAQAVNDHQVAVIQFVPSSLEMFIRAKKTNSMTDLLALRHVICGGEKLTKRLVSEFYSVFDCRLSNHYGPTEITVDAVVYDCSIPFDDEIVPIGRPIDNVTVYILDEDMRVVPVGVEGEIYIHSPGLARGYLNQESLTADSFISHPFESGKKLYRTKDRGKYTDDGTIVYLSRKDDQIKIRGNRIELGEIERQLDNISGIQKSAILYNEAQHELCAYIELEEKDIQVTTRIGERFKKYTAKQRPQAMARAEELHYKVWPAFFSGDEINVRYWPLLYTTFAGYQIMLFNEKDEIVAVANSIPIHWDGDINHLPSGWDGGLESGFVNHGILEPNTLLVLAAVVSEEARGKGLSTELLKQFKSLAQDYNLDKVLVPVRPTDKVKHPDMSFKEWCTSRRNDGQLADSWLRVHEKIGGVTLKIETQSQLIVASHENWEKWSNQKFVKSGEYVLHNTLQPVQIDIERGIGKYYDPCVWVEHQPAEQEEAWEIVDVDLIVSQLEKYLPSYMLPKHYMLLDRLPLNSNGKIDKKQLPRFERIERTTTSRKPSTEMEKLLANIWVELLDQEQIGVDDNFFDLGGHSLIATIMISKFEMTTGLKIPLKEFLKNPTIQLLAEYLESQVDTKESEHSHQQTIKKQHVINREISEKDHALTVSGNGKEARISNIEPFNDLFYNNCLFNSFFPVMRHFNKNIHSVLANDLAMYHIDNAAEIPVVSASYYSRKPHDEIIVETGIQADMQQYSKQLIDDIKRAILQNRPVIIWVDCYFEPFRKDTYMKNHLQHTWLVYGFDDKRKICKIIEHNHRDSLRYEPMEIGYGDVVACYDGFQTYFAGEGTLRPSYYEFYIADEHHSQSEDDIRLRECYNMFAVTNKKIIEEGLKQFEEWALHFERLVLSMDRMNEVTEYFLPSINNILNIKYVEKYKVEFLFAEQKDMHISLDVIINAWTSIRTILIKFAYANKFNKDQLVVMHRHMCDIIQHEKQFVEGLTS